MTKNAPAITSCWQTEFPDFDTMPAIPAGWTDSSWHNDACPSFGVTSTMFVFVNYEDPDLREFAAAGPRFCVINPDTNEVLFESDDWQAVLQFTSKQ